MSQSSTAFQLSTDTLSLTLARASKHTVWRSLVHAQQRALPLAAVQTQSAIDISMTLQLCSAERQWDLNAGWLTNRKQRYRGISVDLICHFKYTSQIIHLWMLHSLENLTCSLPKILKVLCKKQTDTHWETLFLILDEICICSVFVWACLGF